jgi:hypothetical protein
MTQALLQHGYLIEAKKHYLLTTEGQQWFAHMGVDMSEVERKRRIFAASCLDWSERHYHLAGALGASLASQLFKQGWIIRSPTSRAICLSEAGHRGFLLELDLQF